SCARATSCLQDTISFKQLPVCSIPPERTATGDCCRVHQTKRWYTPPCKGGVFLCWHHGKSLATGLPSSTTQLSSGPRRQFIEVPRGYRSIEVTCQLTSADASLRSGAPNEGSHKAPNRKPRDLA